MVNPTLTWERVGTSFYRTFEGYSLQWAVEVTQSRLAMAPNAGAIAVWERTDVVRQVTAQKPQLSIYSGSGKLLFSIPWDSGDIADVNWSLDEHLVVVARSGVVRSYYDFDGNFNQLRLEDSVSSIRWHMAGFVADTGDHFAFVPDFPEPRVRKLEKPNDEIIDWAVLSKNDSIGQSLEVLFIHAQGKTISSMGFDSRRQVLENDPALGSFTSITVSPDASSVAIITNTNHLLIYTSDFHHARYRSTGPIAGHALKWVGVDAVSLIADDSDNDELIVIDIDNKSSGTLYFDSHVEIFTEIDGARILSNHTHDFLTPVPDIVVDIFRLGSTSKSSILLNSIEQLDRSSPKANENLIIIGQDALPDAVTKCYTAATFEMDARWQKRLLKAAAFGKSSLELFDSSGYLAVMDQIRLANTLRSSEIGIFISVEQMKQMGPQRLINRLELRKQYSIAIAFSKVLRLPVESVYINWATSHVQQIEKDDNELAEELAARLGNLTGLSYSKIAQKAYDEGRPKLALELINKEPKAADRVVLLMDMKEYGRALEEAVESGNVDLVYYVLMILHHSLSLPQFYRSFNDNKLASTCYQNLLRILNESDERSSKSVHDFLYQMDLRLEDTILEFHEAVGTRPLEAQTKKLKAVQKRYRDLRNYALETRIAGEYAQLAELQAQLESEYEKPFAGKSVLDTISSLLEISQVTRAQKVKTSFKIPDNQFWWLRIRVLVDRRDWDGLWDFAQATKSPIGYKPFYEVALKAGNVQAAEAYADMSTYLPYEERVEMYLAVHSPEKALDVATKSKDEALIEQVRAASS